MTSRMKSIGICKQINRLLKEICEILKDINDILEEGAAQSCLDLLRAGWRSSELPGAAQSWLEKLRADWSFSEPSGTAQSLWVALAVQIG